MKVTLKDGAPRSKGEVEINVSKNGNTAEIGATGTNPPIVLEFYEGKLRLRVYGENQDGNQKPIFTSDLATTPAVAEPAKRTAISEARSQASAVTPPVTTPAPAAEPTDDDLAAFDAA